MKLNDFVNQMLDKGFRKSYTKSKKTMFLKGNEILMYVNKVNFFTNNIQISVKHKDIAIFLIDGGIIHINANNIKELTIF